MIFQRFQTTSKLAWLMVTVGVGLSACATPPPQQVAPAQPFNYRNADFKPVISSVDRTYIVARAEDLTRPEIKQFFSEYLAVGGEAIHAFVAQNANSNLVALLRREAARNGLRESEFRLQPEKSNNGVAITLSFKAYSATPKDCPKYVPAVSYDPTNLSHPAFGCSVNRGIAVMVANPHDFVTAKPETPPDGIRRATVLGKYRAGEPTDAERSPYANSGISNVGGN